MSRKQQGADGINSALPAIPQTAPSGTQQVSGDGVAQGIQALSNLLGYGQNTTFGYQMQQQQPNGAQPTMSNLTDQGPLALLQHMWGAI